MQQWEYCLIAYTDNYSLPSYLRSYQASGGTTDHLEKDAVAAKLADLGRQGWELVSVVASGYYTNYYFKRPLP
jgi:hypothetical protein